MILNPLSESALRSIGDVEELELGDILNQKISKGLSSPGVLFEVTLKAQKLGTSVKLCAVMPTVLRLEILKEVRDI
jgi:hypothetical protein